MVAVRVRVPPVEMVPVEIDDLMLMLWTSPASGSTAWITKDLV